MIKENIQININDKSFDAEIIVPSQVMTSTPQEENVDLTKTPNFILKVEDEDKTINVTDIVEVSFSLGDYDYTANMKAYNRGGGIIALQYDSNLTAAPGALILNAEKYYTAYDISETEEPQKSEAITATFNDEAIDAGSMAFAGLVYNDVDVRSGNRVKFVPNDVQIDGKPGVYTDDVTAEYHGAQTSCQVIAVAVDTAAQTGLTVDKPYYACSINQNNTSEQTNAHACIYYNGTELDPTDVQMSGAYYNQYWVWNGGSGDFTADGLETFSGYDVVTITYNNESISCLLKIDVTGLEM